jgi:hypothetical protein
MLLLLTISTFSCVEEVNTSSESDTSISGQWLLYEYGYSPGAGYITEEVPLDPPQVINFLANRKMFTNIQNLKQYRYYRILEDKDQPYKILALYVGDPGSRHQNIYNLDHSYVIGLDKDKLTLSFRWCIEGCHLALKRIE